MGSESAAWDAVIDAWYYVLTASRVSHKSITVFHHTPILTF